MRGRTKTSAFFAALAISGVLTFVSGVYAQSKSKGFVAEETLQGAETPAEEWAASFAGEKVGELRTLNINGIPYRFHWCPAGSFMMGSPETERGRHNNEALHEVTLSHGFWMLETEVTQEMWESITGRNPSEFKGLISLLNASLGTTVKSSLLGSTTLEALLLELVFLFLLRRSGNTPAALARRRLSFGAVLLAATTQIATASALMERTLKASF
jgi:hypothetical protein